MKFYQLYESTATVESLGKIWKIGRWEDES